ncbi:fluoride efflux transporter CrcB [Aneurinibacillus sp. Ricciae_BoGa-3]|uniref:fluoride efflux transporter CrcB n=1 Tax=Aneurinibacillus sp. Ricciae_BoGa-3 TaxID=3022697 RepID=UPI0023417F8A|nr:fluoride efflux transporter CrcB [Aneurinibacillus sp. Ricciae_BoGa-3]WCK52811.1 fluoride efflux transporter CrcB [Aneurinibacillus sp. Ricciae_BoGa-3]
MILTGIGGVIGTLCRYYLGRWVTSKSSCFFPWGTFLINITGSFLLGFLYSLHIEGHMPVRLWLFLGIGFSGGYTTFSTFSYETIQLILNHHLRAAVFYVFFTAVAGLLFCWIGTTI